MTCLDSKVKSGHRDSFEDCSFVNVAGEKTSEDLLRYAMDALSRRRNLEIKGWNVMEDHSVSPGRYVLFLETDPVIRPEDRGLCRDILEEELSAASDFYWHYIRDGHLTGKKLICVQPQTYRLYRDLILYQGTSPSQIKPVYRKVVRGTYPLTTLPWPKLTASRTVPPFHFKADPLAHILVWTPM